MIYALKFKEKAKRGLLKSILAALFGVKPYEEITFVGTVEVHTVFCEHGMLKRKKTIKIIKRICKEHFEFLLLPDDVCSDIFKKRSSDKYKKEVIKNTAKFLLSNCKLPPKELSCGLIDTNAEFTDYVEIMLKYCSELKVFSKNKQYKAVTNRIFDEHGAIIQVTGNIQNIGDCRFIIAPNPIECSICFKPSSFVLTQTQKLPLCGNICSDYFLDVPHEYEKLIDKSTDPFDLYAALLKEDSKNQIINRCADRVKVNNTIISVTHALKGITG